EKGKRRDNAVELQLRGVLATDLPIEDELGRWMALWDAPGLAA
ncbi:MAG: PspA-associated protein PspAB, partial [Nocardioidaceae bacterium]